MKNKGIKMNTQLSRENILKLPEGFAANGANRAGKWQIIGT
jgi:hypothetical protein